MRYPGNLVVYLDTGCNASCVYCVGSECQPLMAKATSLSLPNSPDGRERDVRHVD